MEDGGIEFHANKDCGGPKHSNIYKSELADHH
jgi:hypothetical protein